MLPCRKRLEESDLTRMRLTALGPDEMMGLTEFRGCVRTQSFRERERGGKKSRELIMGRRLEVDIKLTARLAEYDRGWVMEGQLGGGRNKGEDNSLRESMSAINNLQSAKRVGELM